MLDRTHTIAFLVFTALAVLFAAVHLYQGVALNGSLMMTVVMGVGAIASIVHGDHHLVEDTEYEHSR